MTQFKADAFQQEREDSVAKNEEFRLLVEAVTEYAIFRLDPEGHVVTWNTGAEKIKGYAEEEIVGQHLSVFYTPEDREDDMPWKVLETATREGVWTGEGWRVRKDGSRFWAHLTLTALRDEEGDLRGFVKVTRDMTERHQREEALQEAKKRAEQENALLQIMQTVAAAANDADTLEQALHEAVRTVCAQTGWPVGHVYRVRRPDESADGAPRIIPTEIWHLENEGQFEHFRSTTRDTTFAMGEGLPGRVVESARPIWIRDVVEEPTFVRARVSQSLGISGAFGIPVRHSDETIAVLEFFSREPEEPDQKLLDAMQSVSVQLSRVAEREAAEAELRRSEERYRRLFEDSKVGIAITTPEGEIVGVNPATEQMLGYSREELLAMNAADLYVNPEDRAKITQQVGSGGVARNVELKARRKDGKELIVEASTSPQYGPNGEVTGFLTFLSDITERKRAEVAVQESEARFKALAENADIGIVLVQDGVYEYVNPALARISGYPREELIGQSPAKLFQSSDRAFVEERMRLHLAGEVQSASREMSILTKGGEVRTVEMMGTQVTVQGERAMIGTMHDVTERKRAEEALRESEAKFRALAEESPTGITVIQDGKFKYVNNRYAEIFGYERDEMIDSFPAEEIVHPDDRHIVREHLRKRIEGEVEAVQFQVRGNRKSGEICDIEIRGRRLTYHGRPAVIGSVLDISKRRRAERALRESEEKFRALAEEAPVGILLVQNGRFQYANETLAHMYGYTPQELMDMKTSSEIAHPSDRERLRNIRGTILSGEQESAHFRFRGITKSGETIHIEAYDARVEYQGAPAIIGMDVNVTDRMRLQREVLSMQEEERRRLGRDLHDGVASQLTTVGLMIDLVVRRVSNGKIGIEEVPDQIKEIQDRVLKSGEDVRRLSRGLALSGLSSEDLPAALERLSEDLEGGRFECGLEGTCGDDATAVHLYRVAQEAAANARKYAEADTITIRLQREEHGLSLEIEDDGEGFDPSTVEDGSLGLRTMRYRAELLGGTLTIDTAPGAGTRVRCRVPL